MLAIPVTEVRKEGGYSVCVREWQSLDYSSGPERTFIFIYNQMCCESSMKMRVIAMQGEEGKGSRRRRTRKEEIKAFCHYSRKKFVLVFRSP